MNLFDWFLRAPSRLAIVDDVIWLSAPAKYRGIQRRIAHSLADPDGPDAILLVAHFRDCENELRQIAGGVEGPVRVVSADDLRNTRPVAMSLGESHEIEIIVGERHPLRSHDDSIEEYARSLPCRARLLHHVSLDELLMRKFAGKWMEGALKNLGMTDDEAIESSMVARRIKAAQQKLASQCHGDLPADSAEQWMAQNCR